MTQPLDSFVTFSVLEASHTSVMAPEARWSEIHKRIILKITLKTVLKFHGSSSL